MTTRSFLGGPFRRITIVHMVYSAAILIIWVIGLFSPWTPKMEIALECLVFIATLILVPVALRSGRHKFTPLAIPAILGIVLQSYVIFRHMWPAVSSFSGSFLFRMTLLAVIAWISLGNIGLLLGWTGVRLKRAKQSTTTPEVSTPDELPAQGKAGSIVAGTLSVLCFGAGCLALLAAVPMLLGAMTVAHDIGRGSSGDGAIGVVPFAAITAPLGLLGTIVGILAYGRCRKLPEFIRLGSVGLPIASLVATILSFLVMFCA